MKDHRQIGQELDLYSFHPEFPGAVLWHPKGLFIYQELQRFIRSKLIGYQEISTPILTNTSLFTQSGHMDHYAENMFNIEDYTYVLKPMNCPASTIMYGCTTRSYKDLPLRLSEFGTIFRNEISGAVGGLFRLRQFTQDDAHIYVRPDQIKDEVINLINLIKEIYLEFQFKARFCLATKPDKAMGGVELWTIAEDSLKEALSGIKYHIVEKDGAFYGPKIDIHIEDSLGRDWQVATIQLDFQTPEKMALKYIDEKGKDKIPVIIHRAILGSVERFLGILLEHTQGKLPEWLAPIQTVIIPVSDKFNEFAKTMIDKNKRTFFDNRKIGVSARVRDARIQKIPNIQVVGEKEMKL